MEKPSPTARPVAPDRAVPAPRGQRIEAASLFGRTRELELVHQGEVYRLRITRNGKLILTK